MASKGTALQLEVFQQQHKRFFLNRIEAFKAPPLKIANTVERHHSSEDIRIGARVRPLLESEEENGAIISVIARNDTGFVDVHELKQKVNFKPGFNSWSFHLDTSYGPLDNSETLYQDLFQPLVKWSWGGGVSTLFAYGQTGSGKTHSVNEMERLAAAELMNGVLDGERDVYICVFELIGNASYDLLNDHRQISVLEDSFGETQLVGAVEHKPTSAEDLLALIEKSMAFRKTAPTLSNDTSSRSHAVCRIRIVNKEIPELPDGLLYVVDLAGSEMAGDIRDHSRERMKETRDINVSLSILKDCIRGRALVDGVGNKKSKAHIPFRSSVITKVLKNVFDVESARTSKTAVLACVKPGLRDISASKNTLRYAELLRVDVPPPKLAAFDEKSPRTWNNEKLKSWIDTSSGIPPISSSILAPTETGAQLVRLPKGEFISRCQKTSGISAEHARTFYDKLWRLHIDSRATSSKEHLGEAQLAAVTASPALLTTPFKERLRPGMFIRMNWRHIGDEHNIAMIMCPEFAFGGRKLRQEAKEMSYLCARISPAILHDAYNLNLEPLLTVPLSQMESEVFMEFDSATRYYYHMLP